MENGNKPAYPDARSVNNMDGNGWVKEFYTGLTKREYFAAMAMQSMISRFAEIGTYQDRYGTNLKNPESIAIKSIQMAEALLKHLDNGDKNG